MKKKILFSILIIVSIFNILSNTVFAIDDTQNLPTSYDLRNDIAINVENQGQREWCAIYSATKVVQTTLAKTRNINYNLSESYLAYSFAEYFGGSFSDLKNAEDVNHSTGAVQMIFGKQVLESDFPNKDYEFNASNKEKFQNADIVIKSAEEVTFNNRETMKKHIMENGGIQVIIDGNQKWYNFSNCAIYCNDFNSNTEQSHGVTIIGWNDNYSRDNFNSNCKPQNNGAWLILNSWGNDWGNNGTAWVSYEDIWIYEQPLGVKNVKIIGDPPVTEVAYSQRNGYVQAIIKSDEELKDIDGWETSDDRKAFIKTFNEQVAPYTINVYSEIDNSSVPVEINITNADFKVYDTNSTIHIEGKYKLNSKDLRLVIIVLVPILIILLFILKHLKKIKK